MNKQSFFLLSAFVLFTSIFLTSHEVSAQSKYDVYLGGSYSPRSFNSDFLDESLESTSFLFGDFIAIKSREQGFGVGPRVGIWYGGSDFTDGSGSFEQIGALVGLFFNYKIGLQRFALVPSVTFGLPYTRVTVSDQSGDVLADDEGTFGFYTSLGGMIAYNDVFGVYIEQSSFFSEAEGVDVGSSGIEFGLRFWTTNIEL